MFLDYCAYRFKWPPSQARGETLRDVTRLVTNDPHSKSEADLWH